MRRLSGDFPLMTLLELSVQALPGCKFLTRVDSEDVYFDVQASAEFRGHLLTVYTKRALGAAVDRVSGEGAAAD